MTIDAISRENLPKKIDIYILGEISTLITLFFLSPFFASLFFIPSSSFGDGSISSRCCWVRWRRKKKKKKDMTMMMTAKKMGGHARNRTTKKNGTTVFIFFLGYIDDERDQSMSELLFMNLAVDRSISALGRKSDGWKGKKR
jgi:hypothetical protein